jgi:hypothetical protein
MTSPTDNTTALGLERLRGELREGLARIEGALQLLVARSDQAEKTAEAHAAKLEKHDQRLDTLEAANAAATNQDVHGRLRQVEQRVWAVGGAITVVLAVGEILLQAFLH